MASNKTSPGVDKRKRQFDSVRLLLSSQRPSDLWKGLDQVRVWLNEDPEDRDVYGLLLDSVDKNRDIREQVRNLFLDMMKRESKRAEEAFALLPSSVEDLLADADDAFYAAEYERAIQLYRQVLTRDPENSRAKSHLAEARKESPLASETNPELPRDAKQYFRRARSYIAARDYSTAMKMLGAALETAQTRGIPYPEAENLLSSIQDISIAEEFKGKIYDLAINKNQWQSALDVCASTLPDFTGEGIKDAGIKYEFNSIYDLLSEELVLQKKGLFKVFAPISKLQKKYRTAQSTLAPKDALLGYIKKELNRIILIRVLIVIIVFALVVLLVNRQFMIIAPMFNS